MKKKLNGAQLKWLAIITMLIDHIGAVVIYQYAVSRGIGLSLNPGRWSGNTVEILYVTTRLIGRLAFPIFCFLITEGFYHTRDVGKYLRRLGIFALISEIPFDLATDGVLLEYTSQNVFFTLFYGVLTLYLTTLIADKMGDKFSTRLLQFAVVVAMAFFNEKMGSDYGYYGIMLIYLIYQFRDNRLVQSIVMFIMGLYQMTACLSSLLTYQYNGERGNQPKYFFYAFYPVHLLILYGIVKIIL